MSCKVMMFSKKNNLFCDYAELILKSFFKDEFISIRGDSGEPFDLSLSIHKPKFVISFVSPWIIPERILQSAKTAAINFHPGSPDYPGTGCYNFALYEQAKTYGITCHHMNAKVDTGQIIMTSYFSISEFESVESLKLKSMTHLLYCFERIINMIANDEELPVSSENWRRKPFTRKQMLELFYIPSDCTDESEIQLKLKASSYPSYKGAYTIVEGRKFYFEAEDRKPIV